MRLRRLRFTFFLLVVVVASAFPEYGHSTTRVVKIGSLLDPNKNLGSICLSALQLAVEAVNSNPFILNDTRIELVTAYSNSSAFAGAAAAISLLQSEVVAIAGPQSTEASHFIAHIAAHSNVPVVSYSITDPALSEQQYPYFVRLTWSDTVQMTAVASLIRYYGWREVIALFVDDDYGKNGVDALGDLLEMVGSKIIYKAALDITGDNYEVVKVLTDMKDMESRVFVLHMQPEMGRFVLMIAANYLNMMTTGYVWIVTDSIVNNLDTNDFDNDFIRATQGVIGTKMYTPVTQQLQDYLQIRNNITGRTDTHYHPYELIAYESIWMISYALDRFLTHGYSLNFSDMPLPSNFTGASTDLAQLKVLQDGNLLLKEIQATNFTSLTGFVKVDGSRGREDISFEIVNRVDVGLRVVGYWINGTGCTSAQPPVHVDGVLRNVVTNLNTTQKLQEVIWPGGGKKVPNGWVVPRNGRPLTIGVPYKTGYKEFVTTSNDSSNATVFRGFCINVFESAIKKLDYPVSYVFEPFGDGSMTPNYSDLVQMVENKKYDGVVGDVTITRTRSQHVDFTQPYTTSGLVMVVPLKAGTASYAWAFIHPFTPAMWCTTGAFFLLTGLVIWMLEHKKNRDFRGRPKKQIVTTLWFIFSTLFFSQREKVKSTLGRAVLVIWLFVVLIVTSSYTASLTSMLTVEQLTPTIKNIIGLLASDVPIGYQRGSFVEDYLLQMNVAKERLVPLSTLQSYAKALKKGPGNGGVGAIVDELPYVQMFLSTECDFTIAGQEFSKGGWGFAFPKGSQLAIDISTAILELTETGELQKIHDFWLSHAECSSKVQVQSNELPLRSFWGLFLITGVTSFFCVICYYIRMIWQYKKTVALETPPPAPVVHRRSRKMSRLVRGASFLKSLASFIEEAEETEYESKSARKSKSLMNTKSAIYDYISRASMSERSVASSARDSMVSVEETRAELRELIKELSQTVKGKRPSDDDSIEESNMEENETVKKNLSFKKPTGSSRSSSFKLLNDIREEMASSSTHFYDVETNIPSSSSRSLNYIPSGLRSMNSKTFKRSSFRPPLNVDEGTQLQGVAASTSKSSEEITPEITSNDGEKSNSNVNPPPTIDDQPSSPASRIEDKI